ncbi:MAG: hypothetical protein PHN75_19715, partial [Syntrophales bacterium]|nr:hypothetical protein [Syntrophales bacterium]
MKKTSLAVLAVLCLLALPVCAAVPLPAADPVMEKVLPAGGFSKDWVRKDEVVFHNQDTLFEHINGEAELYMPYGFELLATETFINRKDPEAWLVADVYKMASSLDAFGIYSNYRKADYQKVNMGGDGFISPTQLMFYQDRYFVRLQVTGINNLEKRIFLDLGRVISEKLPAGSDYPREIEVLRIPEVIQRSERYIAQSLLGYAFFRRGMIADTGLPGERPRVFVVIEDSSDAAVNAFEQYQSYLKAEGQDV